VLHLHGKGTGIYDVRHHFYRLIDDQVVTTLVLPAEVRYFWIGMPLHTEVSAIFVPNEPESLSVRFRCRCYAFEEWSDGSPFFDNEIDVWYKWNEPERRLVPEIPQEDNTKAKLDCLYSGSVMPAQFLKAFAAEAAELEQHGSLHQRRTVKRLRQWREKEE